MALRKKLFEILIFKPTSSDQRRWYGRKKDLRVLRSMVKKRIERRSSDYPIKAMIPVAREVLKSRSFLFHGVSSLLKAFPVVTCKFCSEVYIGEEGHLIKSCIGFRRQSRNQLHKWSAGGLSDVLVTVEAFHLRTMHQEIIKHDERFDYDRVPAVVELCLQAGAQLVDGTDDSTVGTDPAGSEDLKSVAEATLAAWEVLRSGVGRLLLVYPTKVCRNCSEVHVGPSGHLARNCGLFKFQRWRGTHYWEKAGVDDLVPPRMVWRRRPQDPPLLVDEARDFYGHAPAVVDLCSKVGIAVPVKYWCMMKIHGLSRPLQSVD